MKDFYVSQLSELTRIFLKKMENENKLQNEFNDI